MKKRKGEDMREIIIMSAAVALAGCQAQEAAEAPQELAAQESEAVVQEDNLPEGFCDARGAEQFDERCAAPKDDETAASEPAE